MGDPDENDTTYIHVPYCSERLPLLTRTQPRPEYKDSALSFMSKIRNLKQIWLDYFDADSLVDQHIIENGNTSPMFVDVSRNYGGDVTWHLLGKVS